MPVERETQVTVLVSSDTSSMLATSISEHIANKAGDLYLAAVGTRMVRSYTQGAQCKLLSARRRVDGVGMHRPNMGHQPTC